MMQADEPGRDLAPAARLQRLAGFILDASLFWLLAATTVSIAQAIRSAVLFAEEESTNSAVAQIGETLASLGSWFPDTHLSPLATVVSLYGVYSLEFQTGPHRPSKEIPPARGAGALLKDVGCVPALPGQF